MNPPDTRLTNLRSTPSQLLICRLIGQVDPGTPWPVIALIGTSSCSTEQQTDSAYELEPNDNPGGEPKVILRTASELRQQVVSLTAPIEPVGNLGINAASEGHRKGRISETRAPSMLATKSECL